MKQLDPKAVWLFFIQFLYTGFLLLIFLGFFFGVNLILFEFEIEWTFLWWLVIFFILYIGFCYIWAQLTYRFYRYELTDDGFRKETGVIWKKYVTIPYDRIQNVDIYRGVLARILGLSDLHIQTAGLSHYGPRMEGRLPGLSRETAEQLRDELIRRARQSKNQGL